MSSSSISAPTYSASSSLWLPRATSVLNLSVKYAPQVAPVKMPMLAGRSFVAGFGSSTSNCASLSRMVSVWVCSDVVAILLKTIYHF
jgi:hypothetical protein